MNLQNSIRGVVQEMLNQRGTTRCAVVTSVDSKRGLVKVAYDEEGTTSGWLPTLMVGVGNGASMGMLPTPGTQVVVQPDMGAIDHGIVLGALHSDQQPPQQITPYKADEAAPVVPGYPFWVLGGNSIQLTPQGFMIRGNVFVDGDLKASGQISDLDGIHGSLDTLRQAHNTHRHTNVGTGGTSNVPDKLTP